MVGLKLFGLTDHGGFSFLASWPSGRARGRAQTKMVGPRPYLSIASAAIGPRYINVTTSEILLMGIKMVTI